MIHIDAIQHNWSVSFTKSLRCKLAHTKDANIMYEMTKLKCTPAARLIAMEIRNGTIFK